MAIFATTSHRSSLADDPPATSPGQRRAITAEHRRILNALGDCPLNHAARATLVRREQELRDLLLQHARAALEAERRAER